MGCYFQLVPPDPLGVQGCPSAPSPSPSLDDMPTAGLAEGYEYVGCFADAGPMSTRDMPLSTKKKFDKNKAEMCAVRCATVAGAAFFGLQNAET